MQPYATYQGTGLVQLFDRFGKPYYHYEGKGDRPFYFNVRFGEYRINGTVTQINEKMIYEVGSLDRWADMPETVDVVFTDNGEKAALYPGKGILCLDHGFKKEPLFNVYFAFGHEIAHYIFPSINGRTKENEFNCDKFSAKFMLMEGFNPSQVLSAMKFVLGDGEEHEYRYDRMISFLNSVKVKFVNEN